MCPARNGFSRKPDPLDDQPHPLEHFPTPLEEDFRNVPFDVAALRKRLRMSQTEFSHRFDLPLPTLRHWEAGERAPRGSALALLRVIAYHPAVVMRALTRARNASREKPDPRTVPTPIPIYGGHRAVDDDFDL
jgi:hypothetical protein